MTVIAAALVVAGLPDRIRLVPPWVPILGGVIALAPMVGVTFASNKARWLRVERIVTFALFAAIASGTLTNLSYLVALMIRRPSDIHGLALLSSSIGVWVNNVIMFSLLYWQLDRGGPGVRKTEAMPLPDWVFPQETAPQEDVAPGWRPSFVDYLYLAFSTATAFSTTDAPPLTPRAKLAMMLEAGISLVTILVVAARAINVLGT
jgi:hypothetical protein